MDNTAQNNQINSSVGQPIQNPSGDKVIVGQNQYIPSASSLNKETGVSAFSEIVKPSEEEVKVGEELKNVGIVSNTDKPRLDAIHEQIGVKASADATPVNITPTSKIVLPMTEEEADETLKMKQSKFNLHENVGEFAGEYTEDSLPFFAALIKKVFREMHRRVFGNKP